ncbi:MAG: hypothetical protein NTW79_03355 [Candidatus Berkelbacteria bacterium]|nr:hypothetical protein [Candidatus Berkelbacteria bacterium]
MSEKIRVFVSIGASKRAERFTADENPTVWSVVRHETIEDNRAGDYFIRVNGVDASSQAPISNGDHIELSVSGFNPS